MAKPSDAPAEVSEALDRAASAGPVNPGMNHSGDTDRARRVEALALRLAGISYEQIGQRLGISSAGAMALINRTLDRAENTKVEDLRELENARLDRAQAAIWDKVIQGDNKSIDTFLRISVHRSRINGMNAPTRVELNVGIRNEMEQALSQLEDITKKAIVVQSKRAIESAVREDEEDLWRPSS